MAMPTTYSKTQIYLHWIIALLVGFQIVLHDSIVSVWHDRMTGVIPNEATPNLHVAIGVLILVLALWRLVIRLTRGAPALPESEHSALKMIAAATHALFYALLFAMPISGAAAWFLGIAQPANAHTIIEKVLVALIILHIVAGFAQHFWFKTNVLKRMLGMK